MQLRPYQSLTITESAKGLRDGKQRLAVQLPTGGGKTVIFSAISQRYTQKSGKAVLILVHRKELLEQTRRTLYNLAGIAAQPIVAGMKHIPEAMVYVGMVESVNRRVAKLQNIGMVIIDEAHIASFNKMIVQHFADKMILGFTATPLSANKKYPMNMFYNDIVCGADICDLIKDGHLCQNITWAPKETVDRMEIAMKGDEFDERSMMQAFAKPKYIANTVQAYEKWAKGTKTVIFNVNIFHSQEVTRAFTEAGYNCRHLDGEMDKTTREEILAWFKVTPDAILCNVAIATTGWDEPTVETVIVNKATMSMPLWLQMCGRGGRPTPSKAIFTIIDMGGNAVVHGDWCNPRDWRDIFVNPPKPGASTTAPVKSCPCCEAIIPASARVCQYCGYVYPTKEIPAEIALSEFIVVTKGIDVVELKQRHANKKHWYTFFEIGRLLAEKAKQTCTEMNDEYAIYITAEYFKRGKEWANSDKKPFSKWHQETAIEHITKELKTHFPAWQPQAITLASIKEYLAN